MKTAGARRKARELTLSLLFAADVGERGPGQAMSEADHALMVLLEVWNLQDEEREKLRGEIESYGRRLADLYFRHGQQVDQLINDYSHEWALDRMPAIDRNLLRLALTELLHCTDVPVSVAINEAVELSKEYGGADSGKFINGILGAFARDNERFTAPL